MEPDLRTKIVVRALKRLREEAGMTQEQAGERLRFTNRKMSRIERGQLPTYHELQAMLDLYLVPVNDWDAYLSMWERARETGWWRAYGIDDRGYVPLESQAVRIRSYRLGLIDGLLQTADYATDVFRGGRVQKSQRSREVEIRLRRQSRLTDEAEPVVLHSIIDEQALSRPLPYMRDQLAHLIMVSDLENVTIQVLPMEVGLHSGLVGSFVLLDFVGGEELAYIEHMGGSLQLERVEDVRPCRLGFEKLASLALNPVESAALLEGMVARL